MSLRKWLIMLPIVILLAVGCCTAFNILVDPFGVFGDPVLDWYSYNETNAPGVAKLAWLDRHYGQYDSYVIGSSSAAVYSVEELNGYLDASFYNLSVYGSDAGGYRDLAAYVLEHYTVKNIVLSLGIDEAVGGDGERDLRDRMHARAVGGNLPLFYLEYALTTTRQSVEKLAARSRDTELPQPFDTFLADSGCWDRRVQDVEKIGDLSVYESAHAGDFSDDRRGSEQLPRIAECARAVADIRDMCAQRGVSLTVIASPVYVGQWNAYDEAALRDYKTALAGAADYWDFSYTPISFDSRYFYDQTHFRSAAGAMVLAEIFGNDDVYRPERFGTQVTADNCQAYLDKLFADPPRPEVSSYTADVPVLLYHHISENPADGMTVSPETFEEQMRFLAENGYHAVTIRQMIDYVCHGGELPGKPVCITFDDGYLSNYEYALPVLERYGLNATVYAIGVSVGHDRYYKDTQFGLTPHFSFEQAREMISSGVIDVQSHTYDMHQWPPFESGDRVRKNILPLEGESDADYAAAVNADMELYAQLAREELGREFTSLAYPEGAYTTFTEVLVHQAGIPVTMSTRNDSRNVLVRGLPQSLYALCRWYMTEGMTPEDILAVLVSP